MVVVGVSFFCAGLAAQRVLCRVIWLVLILAREQSSIFISEGRPVLGVWLQLLYLYLLLLGHRTSHGLAREPFGTLGCELSDLFISYGHVDRYTSPSNAEKRGSGTSIVYNRMEFEYT